MSIKINGQVVIDDSRTACVCTVAIGGTTVIDSSGNVNASNVCTSVVKYSDGSCLATGNGLGVPTATIAPYMTGTQPSGWISMDGSTYYKCDYQNLSSCIGTLPNTLSVMCTCFCIMACGLTSGSIVGQIGSTMYTAVMFNRSIFACCCHPGSFTQTASPSFTCINSSSYANTYARSFKIPQQCNYIYVTDPLCCVWINSPPNCNLTPIPTQPLIDSQWMAYGGCNCRLIWGNHQSPCISYSQTTTNDCCFTSVCTGQYLYSVQSIGPNHCLFVATSCAHNNLMFSVNGCTWTCYTNVPACMSVQCAFIACANNRLLLNKAGYPAWISCDGCTWCCIGCLKVSGSSCFFTVGGSCASSTAVASMVYYCGYYIATSGTDRYYSTNTRAGHFVSGLSTDLVTWNLVADSTANTAWAPGAIGTVCSLYCYNSQAGMWGYPLCTLSLPYNYNTSTQFYVPCQSRMNNYYGSATCGTCANDCISPTSTHAWNWYIKT